MNKVEAAGQLIQRAVELSEFDVRYKPRDTINAQVLAYFIAEFTPSKEQHSEVQGVKQWVFHVDGSSMQHAGGIGLVLHSLEGDHLEYAVCL